MKKIFISILLITLFQNLFSQDTIKIYFDKDWNKIKNSENASFYRKIYKNNGLWYVKDFYKNGQIQMEGSYKNKKCTKKEGEFTYYYENGNIDNKGKFINNKQEGVWNWYFHNGKKSSEELYLNNKRIKAQFWDLFGTKVDSSEAEYPARFEGGEQGFRKFVETHLRYPKSAENDGIEGQVLVRFVIEKDGSLSNIRVIKPISYDLNNEAVRVIRISPKWNPGKLHNRNARTEYTFPISFILR